MSGIVRPVIALKNHSVGTVTEWNTDQQHQNSRNENKTTKAFKLHEQVQRKAATMKDL